MQRGASGRGGCRIVAALAALLSVPAGVAQTPERVARIGLLCSVSCDVPLARAIPETLATLGWHEGKNLVIERRAAGGHSDRLPGLARGLAATHPEVILACGPQGSQAAKAKAVGVTVPSSLLLRADEVIE